MNKRFIRLKLYVDLSCIQKQTNVLILKIFYYFAF